MPYFYMGESGSCMQLVTAFPIAMGFEKTQPITLHQGEMYIVIQEQNYLKYIHLNCIDVF